MIGTGRAADALAHKTIPKAGNINAQNPCDTLRRNIDALLVSVGRGGFLANPRCPETQRSTLGPRCAAVKQVPAIPRA